VDYRGKVFAMYAGLFPCIPSTFSRLVREAQPSCLAVALLLMRD